MPEAEKKYKNDYGLTRRSFLKTSAFVAGAAALVGTTGCTLAPTATTENSEETVFSGICRGNCSGGCFLNVHVRDGKVVRTSMRELPDPSYNRICIRGLTYPLRLYSEHRVKYPMRRVGERGSGEWEQITWDEALDLIGKTWRGYIDEYGNTSVAQLFGTGSYCVVNGSGAFSVVNRFENTTGISEILPVFDSGSSYTLSRMLGVGPAFTGNDSNDFKNAKTFFIWGANPSISQLQNAHFISEAQEQGTKVIAIDTWFGPSVAKADQFVPIKAGTDGALAYGMMNVVVENGWEDRAFLETKTVAPFLVKASDGSFLRTKDLSSRENTAGENADAVSGGTGSAAASDLFAETTGDASADMILCGAGGAYGTRDEIAEPLLEGSFEIEGIKVKTAYTLLLEKIKEYPVSKVSELTGIPVETIEDLTYQFACNKPSTIYNFYGIDHYYNGHWSTGCIVALAALTGNIGQPGAFVGTNVWMGYAAGNPAAASPGGEGAPATYYHVPLLTEGFETGDYGGNPFNLKSAFIIFSNITAASSDWNDTMSWLSKLEFVVGCDFLMTDTMNMCDIVLPAAHWAEKEDIYDTSSCHPYLIYQEKAVEPAFDSKPEIEIYNALAAQLGYGDVFTISTEEYIDLWLQSDINKANGVTYETLKQTKVAPALTADENGHVQYVFGGDGTFPTATGKVEFYLENPVPSNPFPDGWDFGKERLPYWEPGLQVGDEERKKTYPIQLYSEHSRYYTHSQWWESQILREIDPRPYLKLSPADAEELGIERGDSVKVYNEIGHVELIAQINPGLPKGIATCPKSRQKDVFQNGVLNTLLTKTVNPFCCNQALFDNTVAIEKIRGR